MILNNELSIQYLNEIGHIHLLSNQIHQYSKTYIKIAKLKKIKMLKDKYNNKRMY